MQAADFWLLFVGISVYKAALPQNRDLLDGQDSNETASVDAGAG
jgi:hypothetical protein